MVSIQIFFFGKVMYEKLQFRTILLPYIKRVTEREQRVQPYESLFSKGVVFNTLLQITLVIAIQAIFLAWCI